MKKLLFTILLAVFSLQPLFLPSLVNAQNPWYNPTKQEFFNRVMGPPPVEVYGERYTFAQVVWIVRSLELIFFGDVLKECTIDFSNPDLDAQRREFTQCRCDQGDQAACDLVANGTTQEHYAQKSPEENTLQGLTGTLFDFSSNRMASGVEWLKETASKFSLIPEAKAQGYGYRALNLVRELWTQSRNIAYGLLILVVIALAFMIMFRLQISPRVVITVQSAIPKLALAIVLITFSYAIAGLVIDLAFLVHGLIASVVAEFAWHDDAKTAAWQFSRLQDINGGIWSWFWIVLLNSLLGGGIAVRLIGQGNIIASAGLWVVDLIISLLLIIVFIITIIRIFWMLLKHYFAVILIILAGPFMILFGTIKPEIGFGMWLKQLIANISVFVMTGLLIVMAHLLYWRAVDHGIWQNWDMLNPYRIGPPPSGGGGVAGLPSFSFGDADTIGFLIGVAAIIATPSLAQSLKNFILGLRGQYGGELAGAAAVGAFAGKQYGGLALGKLGAEGKLPGPLGMILQSTRLASRIPALQRISPVNILTAAKRYETKTGLGQKTTFGEKAARFVTQGAKNVKEIGKGNRWWT